MVERGSISESTDTGFGGFDHHGYVRGVYPWGDNRLVSTSPTTSVAERIMDASTRFATGLWNDYVCSTLNPSASTPLKTPPGRRLLRQLARPAAVAAFQPDALALAAEPPTGPGGTGAAEPPSHLEIPPPSPDPRSPRPHRRRCLARQSHHRRQISSPAHRQVGHSSELPPAHRRRPAAVWPTDRPVAEAFNWAPVAASAGGAAALLPAILCCWFWGPFLVLAPRRKRKRRPTLTAS